MDSSLLITLFEIAARFVGRVPRTVEVPITLALAGALSRRDTVANRNNRKNIGRVLGLPAGDPAVLRSSRIAVQTQALNYLDLFRMPAETRASILDRVFVEGQSHLDAALRSGHGAVLASLHLGNPDRGGQVLVGLGYRTGAIVERLQPPRVHTVVSELRGRLGAIPIALDSDPVVQAGAVLRAGGVIGVATDLDLSGNGPIVPFVGHQLKMPAGAALLAIRFNAPIVPFRCLRLGHSAWRVTFDHPIAVATTGPIRERIVETSVEIAREMETHLTRTPEQWVQFHDVWAD